MMKEEQSYIEQVLTGDAKAYRHLVERYQTGLIIHCENILKNRQDAEDAAQEAFIKTYGDLTRFKGDRARFSTWLYKVASNLCIDMLRKNKRKVDIENIELYMETNVPQYMENEESDRLRKMVDDLDPPKYADIIKGYFWEGKSYQALAREHQTTTGTIGTWLTRAKAQLKEKLS